jgi:hypothetical protein
MKASGNREVGLLVANGWRGHPTARLSSTGKIAAWDALATMNVNHDPAPSWHRFRPGDEGGKTGGWWHDPG